MRISPINTINSTSFNANIKPTKALNDGFNLIERDVNSIIMKDMDYAKDFLDSLAKISESDKVSDFKIEIDKRRLNHTYTKINGRRVSGGYNEDIPNIQDSYLVAEGVKRFASKIEKSEPSILDMLKEQDEDAQRVLDVAKERYSARLKAEFQQAKQIIFNSAK